MSVYTPSTESYVEYRAREKLEEQERHRAITAIAEAIVTQLGPPWRISPPDPERLRPDYVNVEGPEGMRLRLSSPYNHHDRVEVHGVRPPGAYDPYNLPACPTVSAALSRGPDAIARDFIKRLLPAYRSIFTECQRRAAQTEDYLSRRAATLHAIAEAGLPGFRTDEASFWFAGGGRGSVTPGKVSLELNDLPLDTALQIAALLRAERPS